MCDPISIGSLALGAIGSGISAYERNKTNSSMIKARNAATLAELQRQREYNARTQAEFGKSMDLFNPNNQAERLTTEQNNVADLFQRTAPTAEATGSISTGNAPRVVADTEGKEIADVFGRNLNEGNALSKVAGYDQRFFNNNVDLNKNARNIDLIGDFAKTSAAVSGVEQRAAYNNAFRPPSGIGDLLSFAGSVGGFKAGQGWNPFGGSAGMPLKINMYG